MHMNQWAGPPWRSGCGRCGLQHPRRQCPAWRALCRHCHHRGHFARSCHTPMHRYEAPAQKPKSRARQTRDLSRLQEFLRRKEQTHSRQNFPTVITGIPAAKTSQETQVLDVQTREMSTQTETPPTQVQAACQAPAILHEIQVSDIRTTEQACQTTPVTPQETHVPDVPMTQDSTSQTAPVSPQETYAPTVNSETLWQFSPAQEYAVIVAERYLQDNQKLQHLVLKKDADPRDPVGTIIQMTIKLKELLDNSYRSNYLWQTSLKTMEAKIEQLELQSN